jgi:Glucose / Sorbosone dehydrogenase
VYYTDTNGDIAIARYVKSATDPNQADPSQVSVLQNIPHPNFSNHNGGMLAFGPDGCLYAGVGDGGSGGDPNNNAQNTSVRLGKILRLDPNTGGACANGISNPFVPPAGAPEIWSLGLRNPWRFSFDRQTNDLYIGDVGEGTREEVDVALAPNAGRESNYGWRLMEGFGCSIIGGYVYRGTTIPALAGTYFYADLCAGFVRSFRLQNGQPAEQFQWPSLSPGSAGGTVHHDVRRRSLALCASVSTVGLFHADKAGTNRMNQVIRPSILKVQRSCFRPLSPNKIYIIFTSSFPQWIAANLCPY